MSTMDDLWDDVEQAAAELDGWERDEPGREPTRSRAGSNGQPSSDSTARPTEGEQR